MNEVIVGDHVKSFDFDAREDCYISGTVVEIGKFEKFFNDCNRYKILVDKIVFAGEEQPLPDIPQWVYPPVNGTTTFFGRVTNGVKKT